MQFDLVWARIASLQGETFHQKTGRAFTYTITGSALTLSTTNRSLGRAQFRIAYERGPVRGPGELQDLQGPSYLWAILSDPRVTQVPTATV